MNYYEGQQPLPYMHPKLLATLNDRVRQLVINWRRQVWHLRHESTNDAPITTAEHDEDDQ